MFDQGGFDWGSLLGGKKDVYPSDIIVFPYVIKKDSSVVRVDGAKVSGLEESNVIDRYTSQYAK